MKLEVGMYARYKNFQNKIKIAKIKGIQKANEVFQYDYMTFDNDKGEFETNIIKASFNMIDILEVGDYVNGSEVLGFENEYIEEDDKYVPFGVITESCYLDNNKSWIIEKEIKSVITHEQMEQMAYKVGE